MEVLLILAALFVAFNNGASDISSSDMTFSFRVFA